MTKEEAIYVRDLLERIDAIEEIKEEIIHSYNTKLEDYYYAGTLLEDIYDELVGVLDKHIKNAENELASISFSKPEGKKNNER
jgi:hypothetical protein